CRFEAEGCNEWEEPVIRPEEPTALSFSFSAHRRTAAYSDPALARLHVVASGKRGNSDFAVVPGAPFLRQRGVRGSWPGLTEEFEHGVAVAHVAELALEVVELRARVDAQGVVERGGQVADMHRPLAWVGGHRVRRADHPAAAHAPAGQHYGVAV